MIKQLINDYGAIDYYYSIGVIIEILKNPNLPQMLDYPYKLLIIGGSGLRSKI